LTVFSAKGAAFSGSLGQRTRIYGHRATSAESAIHVRRKTLRIIDLTETRFQRLVTC